MGEFRCVMVVVWGVAELGVWGVGLLLCGRISLQGSCFVGGVTGKGSCSLGESRCEEVVVRGSCSVGESWCGRVAVHVNYYVWQL